MTGPQDAVFPCLSPDRQWILYWERPSRLMRVSVIGGVRQSVFETRDDIEYSCARAPARVCAVSEASQDDKQFTITAFDPVKGRGEVLRSIPKDSRTNFVGKISPDGTTFALSKAQKAEIHIRLLSLTGASDREITVKGWPRLIALDWSADGKGLLLQCCPAPAWNSPLCGSERQCQSAMAVEGGERTWGVPSPDGHYLAIRGEVTNTNVWMLEGF